MLHSNHFERQMDENLRRGHGGDYGDPSNLGEAAIVGSDKKLCHPLILFRIGY